MCPLCQHLRKEAVSFFVEWSRVTRTFHESFTAHHGGLHGQIVPSFQSSQGNSLPRKQVGVKSGASKIKGFQYCYWECIQAINAGTVLPKARLMYEAGESSSLR